MGGFNSPKMVGTWLRKSLQILPRSILLCFPCVLPVSYISPVPHLSLLITQHHSPKYTTHTYVYIYWATYSYATPTMTHGSSTHNPLMCVCVYIYTYRTYTPAQHSCATPTHTHGWERDGRVLSDCEGERDWRGTVFGFPERYILREVEGVSYSERDIFLYIHTCTVRKRDAERDIQYTTQPPISHHHPHPNSWSIERETEIQRESRVRPWEVEKVVREEEIPGCSVRERQPILWSYPHTGIEREIKPCTYTPSHTTQPHILTVHPTPATLAHSGSKPTSHPPSCNLPLREIYTHTHTTTETERNREGENREERETTET